MSRFSSHVEVGEFDVWGGRRPDEDRWFIKVFPRFFDAAEHAYVVEHGQFKRDPVSEAERLALLKAIESAEINAPEFRTV